MTDHNGYAKGTVVIAPIPNMESVRLSGGSWTATSYPGRCVVERRTGYRDGYVLHKQGDRLRLVMAQSHEMRVVTP